MRGKGRFFSKYKWPMILALAAVAVLISLGHRMYRKDAQALEAFFAAYEKYDKAVIDLAADKIEDSENKAGDALADLGLKADLKLSSLIKNDGELMRRALEVKELAAKEFASLRAYTRALRSRVAGLDTLAAEGDALTNKRKAAFARFRELGGFSGKS